MGLLCVEFRVALRSALCRWAKPGTFRLFVGVWGIRLGTTNVPARAPRTNGSGGTGSRGQGRDQGR